MAGFANVQVSTSATQAVTEALERWTALMQAFYPGWEPQPADVLTILVEALGPLAQDVKEVEATAPEAIFRRFGTKLLGIAYNEGAAATATSHWTLADNKGHTIPQGAQVAIGNLGFYVEKAVEVKAGATTATVNLVAVEPGAEYNGLTGPAELLEAIDWVTEVAIEGESHGGANAETDSEYMDRLVTELALQAPRPITAANYAAFILNMPSTVLPAGVVVGRATAIDGYNAETKEEGRERCVTTFVADNSGRPLSKANMEAIQAWVRGYRELNFLAFIEEPSYTPVYATVKIHVAEGFEAAAVIAEVKAALEALLSPATWGAPAASIGGKQWNNEKPSKVRYNTILGTIEKLRGVAYVYPGAEGLTIGTAPTPTETLDLTLAGPAPLPETSAGHLVVTTG